MSLLGFPGFGGRQHFFHPGLPGSGALFVGFLAGVILTRWPAENPIRHPQLSRQLRRCLRLDCLGITIPKLGTDLDQTVFRV
jgi:hypothetical protein